MKQKLLLLLIILVSALPVRARDFKYTYQGQTINYTVLNEGTRTCAVVRNGDVSGILVIPEIVKDDNTNYTVTSIESCAFFGCNGLTSVEIPNSVIEIGWNAFDGCSNLSAIEIPNAVSSIGNSAFKNCDNLITFTFNAVNCKFMGSSENPVLPNSLETLVIGDKVNKIPDFAFYGCSKLTSVVIPNSVKSIGTYAFSSCSGLKSMIIGNSVTEIGKYAFRGCRSLTTLTFNAVNCDVQGSLEYTVFPNTLETLVIGDKVTKIPAYSFHGCSKLTSVVMGNAVTSIGSGVFYGCSSLTSIEIPNTVTYIGSNAFFDCKSLTSLSFNAENCEANGTSDDPVFPNTIETLLIGDKVTKIPAHSFHGCSKLKSVIIPTSVKEIGAYAFSSCGGMTYLSFNAENCNASGALNIPVFPNTLETLVIGDKVTKIPAYSFVGCSKLTSVVIPNSVTEIGYGAFYNCGGLTSVVIGNSVTLIGELAFKDCSALRKSVYPNTVKNPFMNGTAVAYNPEGAIIEDGWVYGSEKSAIYFAPISLEDEYTIPESVTSIDDWAFYDCQNLTSVVIGNSVKSIGKNAFGACSGLTSVVMPNSVTKIGDSAFSFCRSLTSVTIPNSVTEIERYAFGGCNKLTTLVFNAENCDANGSSQYPVFPNSLETLEIGDQVTKIPAYSFYECSKLASVEIPNSVAEIGRNAFSGCIGLTSVEIPNSVKVIGLSAFSGCSGLTSLVIGNSVQKIGEQAFFECSSINSLVFNAENCEYNGSSFYSIFPNSLETLVIGDKVTRIPNYAFSECKRLTSVEIPNSVRSIGNSAFSKCSGLTSVVIGNSVTEIDFYAFDLCTGLIKSAYPNNMKNPFKNGIAVAYNPEGSIIEDGWVWGPEKSAIYFAPLSLEGEYTMPESVTSIGSHAFRDCINLTSMVISNTVETINDYAFQSCSGLTSVEIGNSVQSIGADSFSGCSSLTSIVIPNSVTAIGGEAFYMCSALSSVVIGNSVQTISDNAFYGCNGLTKSAYPNTVRKPLWYGTTIAYDPKGSIIEDGWVWGPEKSAIYFAPLSLEGEYTIPESVISIGEKAFLKCSALTSLTSLNSLPPVLVDNSFEGLYDTVNLFVPDEAANSYLATNWSLFKSIRNNSGKELEFFSDGVFEYRLNPTDMTATIIGAKEYSNLHIPERFSYDKDAANPVRYYIKGIGYKAFDGKNVNSVEFNSRSKMEYIGDYAFAGTNISSIDFPLTMKTIGDYAFTNTGLESISIPESIISIGGYAFYNTNNISKIELKEGLVSIGENAFGADSKRSILKSFYLPSTVETIGKDAFKNFGCYQVDISRLDAWCRIDFGSVSANPLYGSENSLFVNGEQLTKLQIPDDIKEIKPYAFYKCKSLKEVIFSEGLEKIGTESFYGLDNIATLTIPSGVVEIGDRTFSVDSIIFIDGSQPINIAKEALGDNVRAIYWGRPVEQFSLSLKNLVSLEIGNTVTAIGNDVFSGCNRLTKLKLSSSIQSIGENSFSGCTSLEEVILPPLVEVIGASAFAGDSNLASIIMGHKVKSIGEKAFDGCKSNTVSITAQTPPTAPNNTFSNYSGKLYLQGEKAKEAYYDAFTCWDRFDSYVMIDAEEIKVEGADKISGKAGDTFQLTATVWPENVTLPQIFWRSTNPEIATVDGNGLVTLQVDLECLKTRAQGEGDIDGTCTIIAETLYNDGPVAEIGVDTTGLNVVEGITVSDNGSIDYSLPYEVYDMNGLKVGETTEGLAKGIYIIRQGKAVVKTVVR